ncbi:MULTISPECIES: dihydrofolate reductase family protein [Staphylococcus]|uniref:Dihydrofolate reductase n=1 Tax=Staphylococcus arlettae TaxID=29378 RepID=A0A380CGX1_9STAP|nr:MULTISPECIES: dihydrofolate reductase family protein [Staphylococcus]MEB5897821.1 dihydrofolate reductase family protein [Staphylococcus arlettae]PNZ56005.1 dihydrofolate reductase [Staphylococcus arlettae]RBA05204.1 Dihydrofolate reductase [Staphylococcus arlettae]RBA05970.1 Dihydrofolate reductase [Staphylococcus arlettae]RBA06711.1 Dihydrofolate reductase [Staphylococcus arlettae]
MTRKVILNLAVTLDGFIEGPNGEIDWCIMEDDMQFDKFLEQIDTILFGRKSYDLWTEYQPNSNTPQSEYHMWELMQNTHKYVFSRTLQYSNPTTTYINNHIANTVNQLKAQPGKDIWLYGGSSIITTFLNQNLVDELQLAVHPIILGAGKPLFVAINNQKQLELSTVNTYKSGVVQLIYRQSTKNKSENS